MNKERLKKLAQKLDKTKPEKFNMHEWCGTTCCIAGHALIMARKSRDDMRFWGDAMYWARSYLDLSELVARELMWPAPVQHMTFRWNATPKQAAKVIRHLIKTGEVDWQRVMS